MSMLYRRSRITDSVKTHLSFEMAFTSFTKKSLPLLTMTWVTASFPVNLANLLRVHLL